MSQANAKLELQQEATGLREAAAQQVQALQAELATARDSGKPADLCSQAALNEHW